MIAVKHTVSAESSLFISSHIVTELNVPEMSRIKGHIMPVLLLHEQDYKCTYSQSMLQVFKC